MTQSGGERSGPLVTPQMTSGEQSTPKSASSEISSYSTCLHLTPTWSGTRFSPDFVDEAHIIGSHPEHIDVGFLKGRFAPAMKVCTVSTDQHLAHRPWRRAKGWHPPTSSTIPLQEVLLAANPILRFLSDMVWRGGGQGWLVFIPCFHAHVLMGSLLCVIKASMVGNISPILQTSKLLVGSRAGTRTWLSKVMIQCSVVALGWESGGGRKV